MRRLSARNIRISRYVPFAVAGNCAATGGCIVVDRGCDFDWRNFGGGWFDGVGATPGEGEQEKIELGCGDNFAGLGPVGAVAGVFADCSVGDDGGVGSLWCGRHIGAVWGDCADCACGAEE